MRMFHCQAEWGPSSSISVSGEALTENLVHSTCLWESNVVNRVTIIAYRYP